VLQNPEPYHVRDRDHDDQDKDEDLVPAGSADPGCRVIFSVRCMAGADPAGTAMLPVLFNDFIMGGHRTGVSVPAHKTMSIQPQKEPGGIMLFSG
jgi:hypothetical protein